MIDFDKFKYRKGDKVRKIGYEAEYEIIDIQLSTAYTSTYRHYRLKNLSPGCLDQPVWLSQGTVHRSYEPCNPAIKVLFEKKTLANRKNRAEERSDDHSLDALRYLLWYE